MPSRRSDAFPELEPFTASRLRQLRSRLLKWYGTAARDLPWRNTEDPYHIWVSEIMLQQTTVTAVIPYFESFLKRFPDIAALAEATEEEVLKLWEGLGYYTRGRNLRKGAIYLCEQHGGVLPDDVSSLQQVPGIGRYTAGAIASFGFHKPAPIVEANTLRLYTRLIAFEGPPRSTQGQRLLWEFASLLPTENEAARINQALMDLGALICTPASPQCDACPLRTCCVAYATGKQNNIPIPLQKPEVTQLVEACAAVEREGKWLLRQQQPGEWWSGLWDFPRCSVTSCEYDAPLQAKQQAGLQRELSEFLAEEFSLQANLKFPELQIRHTVTRYRIRLLCLRGYWLQGDKLPENARWLSADELRELPLSVTARKIARSILSSQPLH